MFASALEYQSLLSITLLLKHPNISLATKWIIINSICNTNTVLPLLNMAYDQNTWESGQGMWNEILFEELTEKLHKKFSQNNHTDRIERK